MQRFKFIIMKKQLVFISISFLVVAFSICSCKKEEDNSPTSPGANFYHPHTYYTYLDTGIIHYKFQLGSYWVYQNDSTALLDSIVVDSAYAFFVDYGVGSFNSDYYKAETYEMKMHDFSTSQYYREDLIFNCIKRNPFSVASGQAIYIPNSTIGSGSGGMEIIAKFPSMTINSSNFNFIDEVKITAANQSQAEFPHDTYLFYTPSIGLIKKEEDLGGGNIQSWSIKRWHIIR